MSTGAAVRWWQLGIEQRPFFARNTALGYPVFMAITGTFGYWLGGIQERRIKDLEARKEVLLAKRGRAAKDSTPEPNSGVVLL